MAFGRALTGGGGTTTGLPSSSDGGTGIGAGEYSGADPPVPCDSMYGAGYAWFALHDVQLPRPSDEHPMDVIVSTGITTATKERNRMDIISPWHRWGGVERKVPSEKATEAELAGTADRSGERHPEHRRTVGRSNRQFLPFGACRTYGVQLCGLCLTHGEKG